MKNLKNKYNIMQKNQTLVIVKKSGYILIDKALNQNLEIIDRI